MRQIAPVLALILALVPAALRAESGMCEYRHPGHPSWDFFAACEVSETVEGGATLREVSVSNGSRFTARDEAGAHSVNGRAAVALERDDATCWRTEGENELICIHPAAASAPAAPVAAPPAATGVDTGFGGGQKGFCLLSEHGALVDYGACVRRENCLQIAAGEVMSCLAEYDWANGRFTEMARAEDWQTLDGADVIGGDPGCVIDEGAGRVFCYSTAAMTAETHPVLAAPTDPGIVAPAGGPAAPADEGDGGAEAAAGD